MLKKKRGRKRFILTDEKVKGHLPSHEVKYLDNVTHSTPYTTPDKKQAKLPEPLTEEKEHELLEDIKDCIDKIENREEVSKDRVDKLPEQVRLRDKKRRWRTHFT